RVTQTILRCAKGTFGKAKEGTRVDKAAWFWDEKVQTALTKKKEAYKQWQKTKAPEHLTVYRKLKRLEKSAVAKAECVDGCPIRKAGDIRVIKTVKSADGSVLRKPAEVRKRWEEYFKEQLNKLSRRKVQEEQQRKDPFHPGRRKRSATS
ncbi:unnamed protein product, partial [Heligmosomoides polygyrus]|uniref:60S ribosomal protein L14 n=1 Tax=Heligmosomoides polygyrus TaxID=6339 RepID=A0A183F7F0_HELPZ